MKSNDSINTCSFCNKHKDAVAKLIVGEQVAICNECVELCETLLHDENIVKSTEPQVKFFSPSFGPKSSPGSSLKHEKKTFSAFWGGFLMDVFLVKQKVLSLKKNVRTKGYVLGIEGNQNFLAALSFTFSIDSKFPNFEITESKSV